MKIRLGEMFVMLYVATACIWQCSGFLGTAGEVCAGMLACLVLLSLTCWGQSTLSDLNVNLHNHGYCKATEPWKKKMFWRLRELCWNFERKKLRDPGLFLFIGAGCIYGFHSLTLVGGFVSYVVCSLLLVFTVIFGIACGLFQEACDDE